MADSWDSARSGSAIKRIAEKIKGRKRIIGFRF
jgi:hypothetical protein